MKLNARNNIIRKLASLKWGCKASTLRPSCLALCYSAAGYAFPMWARSTHARKLNPALHGCCRIISGCLKPTNLDSVHLLYWPVSPLLTSGELLPAAWNAHDKRRTPDTNCSITDQLLAHWCRGRASCAQSRRSTRLQQTAALERQPNRSASLRQNGTGGGRVFAGWIWRTCSVGDRLTDCAQGWAVRKQWWGDGAFSTTPSRWIATAGSHRRWPTSSPAAY